jgi:peptidoglycan/LPS O-acetylase OafA/YrhL
MNMNRTNWKLMTIMFLIGTSIGWAFLKYVPDTAGWFASIPVIPGAILVAPIFILTGGVHGNFKFDEQIFVPLNGAGYVLIVALWMRIGRKWRSKRRSMDSGADTHVH